MKIFDNGWVVAGAILVTAILDLIALPGGFGAGFVLALLYFIAFNFKRIRR